jgi:hypothetical protein
MGFFSWITQDTKTSISNNHSKRGTFPVIMMDDKGNKWTEINYGGYGEFDNKDFYELLAEMNGLSTRDEGLELAFSGGSYKSPNLVESADWVWVDATPENCPDQGYFYDDNDSDDDDDEYYNQYENYNF